MQGEKGTVIGEKSMKNEEYKKLSIKEFTKAAGRYESNHAGIYEMCKKDYPDILEELEKEPFRDLLDAGCGPAPMISLLAEKYPDRHYTGLDLTPAMIEQAKKKNRTIIVIYNSLRKEKSWLPWYLDDYEDVAQPFWVKDAYGNKVGNYTFIKQELGYE